VKNNDTFGGMRENSASSSRGEDGVDAQGGQSNVEQHQNAPSTPQQNLQQHNNVQSSAASNTSADASNILSSLIHTKEEHFIESQKSLLTSIRSLISSFHHLDKSLHTKKHLHLMDKTIEHLSHLFLVIVVGEFNSGKSRWTNAILGEAYLKEGRIPTTECLDIIQYGQERMVQNVEETYAESESILFGGASTSDASGSGRNSAEISTFKDSTSSSSSSRSNMSNTIPKRIHYIDKEFLKGISFIDSPGVNATISKHERITKEFIPRADLVVFLTSVERPFSESEREFLLHIREWKKKIIVVVNKSDLLQNEQEKNDVQTFVKKSIKEALGFEPKIFFVSAQHALERKLHSESLDEGLINNLGADGEEIHRTPPKALFDEWDDMEAYMVHSLNINQRIKLKLLSPVGIAERVLQKYSHTLDQLQERLQEDFRTIETIEKQLESFRKDLAKDYALQQNKLDVIFNDLITQADEFFDEHIAVKNVRSLMRPDQTAAKFDHDVVSHIIPDIEKHINQLIDWIQEKNLVCWKSITDFVFRRAKHSSAEEQLVGSIQSEFHFNRKRLLSNLGESVEVVVNAYDSHQHVDKLRDEINAAFNMTSLMGLFSAGAGFSTLYLAASPVFALSTTLLGGGLGLSLAAAGVASYAIPYRRQYLKKQFRDNSLKLKDRLKKNLQDRFEIQVNEMNEQIRGSIAPYSYFVERKQDEISQFSTRLAQVKREMQEMRQEIEASYPDVVPPVNSSSRRGGASLREREQL